MGEHVFQLFQTFPIYMVKEALQWRPVDPLSPHLSAADDWYNCMFILKSAMIIADAWHLNRHPEVYGAESGFFGEEGMEVDVGARMV